MKFSYNWLQEYYEKKLPAPDKLAEILTLHSFEVEGMNQVGQDWVLEVDILPNRADCLSHFGLAREIAAVLGKSIGKLEQEELKVVNGKLKPINLEIQCAQLVPCYSAIIIEGIKVSQSPNWLKERLETVGIRSINNIVDLTNFVMLETGQPLHAFDYDKIKDQKMILRQSSKGEKIVTLDDKEHKLEQGALVIEDNGRLIDLVVVMGGKLSEVDGQTKNIVLQAGNFDRKSIYQTTKSLGHSTDASAIYTQGIDPNLTIPTLGRAYFLLKQISGGNIVQLIDIYPKKIEPKKIKLEVDKVNGLLGIKVPANTIKSILQNSGLLVNGSANKLEATIPTFRQDLTAQEDLIEEIGRIYGYDKIPAQLPTATLVPSEINEEIVYENKVRDILTGFGFSETYNYSFVSNKTLDICKFKAPELENPVSQEQKYLRPCLIPNLVKNVKDNLRYFDEIKLFELGKIFQLSEKDKITEKKKLAGILVLKEKGNSSANEAQEFYQLKGLVDSLLNKLRISDIWYDDQVDKKKNILSIFHPARRAEIKVGNDLVGYLGKIRPEILKTMGIEKKAAVFELDFEALVRLATEERIYLPPSKYPALIRDIAVLVEQGTKVVEVLNLINAAGGQLVADIDLFDIYEGKELPENKKNLAFHIIYQAEDKTLTEKEVDQLHQKIVKALEEEGGWEIRK